MAAELDVDSCRTTPIPATEPRDLLSDLFRSALPRCSVVETWQFTAPWGFRGATNSAAFYYVLQGGCRLEATGIDAAVSLAVGDLAVLMPGREHCLRDSRNSPAVPLRELLGINATGMRRGVMPDEEGRTARLIYGSVVFDERQIVPLLVSVPPVVVIPGAKERPCHGWTGR